MPVSNTVEISELFRVRTIKFVDNYITHMKFNIRFNHAHGKFINMVFYEQLSS